MNMKRQRENGRLNKENSEFGGETEFSTRKTFQKPDISTVDKDVEEGDSLQSLAIKYHCTIEELKRINNIHKDNEIYARKTIKVPYRPFTEALATVHVSGNGLSRSPTNEPIKTSSLRPDVKTDVTVNEVNTIIFNSNIAPCAEDSNEDIICQDSDEETQLLSRESGIPEETLMLGLKCSGSDWDISWPVLIVLFFILIFAVPLYMFHIAKQDESHHNHSRMDVANHRS